MSNQTPGKWGGPRRNSGRPTGGVREVKRLLNHAISTNGVDAGIDLVASLVLEGRGNEILRIWYDNLSITLEREQNKSNKNESIYVEAMQQPLKLS